jgi:hypothetical protein
MNPNRHRLGFGFAVLLTALGFHIAFGQDQLRNPLDKTTPVRLMQAEEGYDAILLVHPHRDLLNLQIVTKGTAEVPPASQRTESWKSLLEQAFREQGRKPTYLLTVGQYPELAPRLAVAAAASDNCNLKTGKPRSGEADAVIKDLIAHGRFFPELDALFEPFGYRVSVESVEAVMLCRWSEIQPHDVQQHPNIRPDSLVPCGASLVFRLTTSQGAN